MTTTFSGVRALRSTTGKALFGLLCLASAPTPVCAQRVVAQAAAPHVASQAPTATPPVGPAVSDQNAQQTREQLQNLLSDHPPALREVLQRDPGLLTNAEYLAPYPRVASFLAAHPEVGRSPVYFLGDPQRHEPQDAGTWMWREMLTSISVGVLLLMAGLGFGWVVRTALDHRRWQRVSKVQVETHSKLLDRLTSSDDLRAYMESAAGRQFLESAPIALDGKQTPIAAPISRILWSMQVGVVTLLGGGALQFASRTVVDDAAEPLRVLGVLLIAIGAGFLLSAGLSYALSRHLGLLRAPESPSRHSLPQA
jgi:hypothetical protein